VEMTVEIGDASNVP